MSKPLFKFRIDFKDKRRLGRAMIAEDEQEVLNYISKKYNTSEFNITKAQQIGVRI